MPPSWRSTTQPAANAAASSPLSPPTWRLRLHPYGDTRTENYPPPIADDRDERAAVWTARAFYAAVFIALICGAIFVSLWSIRDDEPGARSEPPPVVETVTTLAPPTQVGPPPGTEAAGYVASRQ